jgi:tetratricopeptide (TPR) repeat protein
LQLASSAHDEAALLCLKGNVLRSMGQPEDALQVFRKAVACSETPVDEVRARIGIAACSRMVGAVEDGLQALDAAERAAADMPLHRERAQICFYRGTFLYSRGDLAAGLAAQERAIEHGNLAGDKRWVARGLSGLGDAQYAYGRMRTAHATFRECVEICQTGGYGQIEVANRTMVLNMGRYLNEFREAQNGIQDAIRMARQVGNLRAEMVALLLQGEFLTDAADHENALVSLGRALEIVRSFGNKRMSAYILNHQARALAGLGHGSDARAAVKEAWDNSRETDRVFIGARICGTRALLARNGKARRKALDEGEEILRSGVLAHNVIWFLRDAIDACLVSRDWGMAAAYAARLEETTREEPIPWCEFFIDRGRMLVAHGRGEAATDQLDDIVRRTREIGLLAALPALENARDGTA